MLMSVLAQTQTQADPGVALFIALIVFLAFGAIGAGLARRRFRPQWVGFLLGGLLTWIGLIVIAVMGRKKGPPCVSCGMPLEFVSTGRGWKGSPIPAHVCLACGTQQPFGPLESPIGRRSSFRAGYEAARGIGPGQSPTGGTPTVSPPPFQPVSPWVPTHEVPPDGMAAYGTPDPASPVVANLDPGLPIQLVERPGDWAHVRASNGWEGWVDGRLLQATMAPV